MINWSSFSPNSLLSFLPVTILQILSIAWNITNGATAKIKPVSQPGNEGNVGW